MKNNTSGYKLSDVKLDYLKRYVQGQYILDVGSGKCLYSLWLKQRNPDLKIIAIDHITQNSIPSGIDYFKQNLESALPFQDQTFDTIIAFDIIEHIENEALLINELKRVCKKNGVIIGSVPHDNDKFLPAYNLTFYHRSDVTHKRYYLPETVHSKLESVGFCLQVVELRGGVNPQLVAEFFPKFAKFFVKKGIGLLRRCNIVDANILKSDIFFVAKGDI